MGAVFKKTITKALPVGAETFVRDGERWGLQLSQTARNKSSGKFPEDSLVLDISARRALLIALGEYDPATLPATARTALAQHLLADYRDHPDAGLHGAIDWLFRRRWNQAAALECEPLLSFARTEALALAPAILRYRSSPTPEEVVRRLLEEE